MQTIKLQLTINELSNERYAIEKDYHDPDININDLNKKSNKEKIEILHEFFKLQKVNYSKAMDKEQIILKKQKNKIDFNLKRNMVLFQ